MNPNPALEVIKKNALHDLQTIMDTWCTMNEEGCKGGKMRGTRGEDIETFVRSLIHKIGTTFQKNIYARKGTDDKKLCSIKDTNIKKDHQVDVHIYVNHQFVAVIECKAYLDSCYYVRACDDFKLFKKFEYHVKHYIFTLENSLDEDTRIFTDYVNDNICDKIFYILDGKRSSSKPIYDKKFQKNINPLHLNTFIDTIYELAESSESESLPSSTSSSSSTP